MKVKVVFYMMLILTILLISGCSSNQTNSVNDKFKECLDSTKNSTTGTYGKAVLLTGNCMPGPGQTKDCAKSQFLVNETIYFINFQTEDSFNTTIDSKGCYNINIPNGKYYMWVRVGPRERFFSVNCLMNLSSCSESEQREFKNHFTPYNHGHYTYVNNSYSVSFLQINEISY